METKEPLLENTVETPSWGSWIRSLLRSEPPRPHDEAIRKPEWNFWYRGELQKGVPCGWGETWSDNGDYFKGTFVSEKAEYRWSSFSDYKVHYVNDKKEGVGEYRWVNGDHYKGSFVNDKLHGEGEFTWVNGNQYKGSFVYDILQGNGVMHYGSTMGTMCGAKFEGCWTEWRPTKGVYSEPDFSIEGDVQYGRFVFNARLILTMVHTCDEKRIVEVYRGSCALQYKELIDKIKL